MEVTTTYREFAERFGGVVERTGDLATPISFFDPAADFGRLMLNDFVGRKNKAGQAFAYEFHFLDTAEANAVCGINKGVFCLGINAGLQSKIMEIACQIVAYMKEPLDWEHEGKAAEYGFEYKHFLGDFSENDHRNFLARITKHIDGDRDKLRLLYCTNILTLFVLLHEARHAVDGHVLFLNPENRPNFFLGETHSSPIVSNLSTSLHFFEFQADAAALKTIMHNILSGRLFFECDLSFPEAAVISFLGIQMLSNTWAIDHPDNSITHPKGRVRATALFNVLSQIQKEQPRAKPVCDMVREAFLGLCGALAKFDGNYDELGAPFTQAGGSEYDVALRAFSEQNLHKELMQNLEPLTFDPETLPLV